MKWIDPSEEDIDRALIFIYGPPYTGKTLTSIMTLPKPLLYFGCEPKGLDRTCKGHIDLPALKKSGNFKHGRPESYEDLCDTLAKNEDMIVEKFKAVLFDGITFFMGVDLLGEIQVETGKAGIFNATERPLINSSRTDQTGYGGLATLMNRLCKLIGNIAARGPVVVLTAQQTEDPKWNRELSAGPALAGKKFGEEFPGFFDMIGRVEKREDKDGRVVWPPNVWFESGKDESFTARWSGPTLEQPYFEMDWGKILAYTGKQI